jgi:hypothetical protein
MDVTRYEPGDETAIAELYETKSIRREVLDCWQWRHVDAPGAFSAPAVVLCRHDGQLLGYLSAARSDLVVRGQPRAAAQIGLGSLGKLTGDVGLDARMLNVLLDQLRAEGAAYVYVAAGAKERRFLEQNGFQFMFDVFARSLYIGLEAVSTRLSKAALSPFRKFAKEARRIRTKVLSVPLDEATIEQMAGLFASTAEPVELGVSKSRDYLAWRYLADPRNDYELLTYRKTAGQGIDAFAFVRRSQSDTGRKVVYVDEQWTRLGGRRTNAKLFGEIALLGLTEESDVLRCFAPAGTAREQALLGLGCIRKKVERAFLVKRLDTNAPALSPPTARDIPVSSGDLELYGR